MVHGIVTFFQHVPHWLTLFVLGTMPIGEIKVAIPIGIVIYKMPVFWAMFWAVLGNMVPVTMILIFVDSFHKWIEKKSGIFAARWIKFLAKTQNSFDGKYEKWGLVGLAVFVFVPFPGTGAWSAAIIAFIFGLHPIKSWMAILVGILISATMVMAATLGVKRLY